MTLQPGAGRQLCSAQHKPVTGTGTSADHNSSLLPGALDDTAEQQTTSAAGTVTQAKAAKATNESTNQYSITQMPEDFKVREHTQKGQALSAECGCLF